MSEVHGAHCFYVDHSFYDVRHIGSTYTKLKQEDVATGGEDVLVTTCQRIEAFTTTDSNPFADYCDLPFRHISGQEHLKKRLLSICSGIESQILGEKNIYYQVKMACESCPEGSMMKRLFLEALDTSRLIRADHGFYSPMDYEDVSTSILQEYAGETPSSELNLVIVGSGMLARSFLKESITTAYKNIFFITRAKKNLKKKMEQHLKGNVFTCPEFLAREGENFHCVIATINMDKGSYYDEVKDIVMAPSCRGVFDLSAAPLFEAVASSAFYSDTYSENYAHYVEKINKNMEQKKQLLASVITQAVQMTARGK